MNLYKTITRLRIEQDWGKRLSELGLKEGWELLEDYDIEVRKKIVLFVVYSYDPDSSKLKNINNRVKDKSDIARSLDIEPEIADKLINNEIDCVNEFISVYYSHIKDTDFNVINSCQEMLEFHLEVIRKKSGVPKLIVNGTPSGIDDEETFVKIQISKSKLAESAIDLRDRLKKLKNEYDSKYSSTDEAIRDEVEKRLTANSGWAERMNNKYRNKMK